MLAEAAEEKARAEENARRVAELAAAEEAERLLYEQEMK